MENEDVRHPTDDVAVQACVVLAWEPRGYPPRNFVRPHQPYNVAARALAALRDDKPYRIPRLVQDHIKDLSTTGSVFGERRGGAREAKASSQTKVKTAPVLFAGKMPDKSSRRAGGAVNI